MNPVLAREVARLVVQPVAVLDAGDAGPDGVEDAGPPLGVCGDGLPAVPADLVDDGLHLLDGQALVVRIVVGAAHASGRADLDQVGAGAQHAADGEADLVDGVGDLGHPAGQVGAVGEGDVAVPAGVAERAHRGLQPRSDDPAGLDGRAVARREAGEVAGGGDACVEGLAHPGRRVEHQKRRVLQAPLAWRHAVAEPEVDVGVDEARQDRAARDVDDPGFRPSAGCVARAAGVLDASAFVDADDGVGHCGRARSVDQPGSLDAGRAGCHDATGSGSSPAAVLRCRFRAGQAPIDPDWCRAE